MNKILIIRFSAISNVSMLVPVLDSAIRNQEKTRFSVLSREFLQPLFSPLKNTDFIGADLRGEHFGLKGFFRLFRILRKEKFSQVIDLQNDRRSRKICFFLKLTNPKIKIRTIKRDKIGELRLLKNGYQNATPLKSAFEIYAETFVKAGLKTDEKFVALPDFSTEITTKKIADLYGEKRQFWVGVAPFAQHEGKILPTKIIKKILAYLDERGDVKFFLFGAGEIEYELLSDWETLFENSHAVFSALNLSEELALMRRLDVMISMDSANMHLASLVACPVISIWGATHQFSGGGAWRQNFQNVVQKPVECRPCSITGRKRNFKCPNSYRCLEISPEIIIEKIVAVLGAN